MGRNIIPFELRPVKDDDIKVALEQAMKKENRSTIIREALRHYLLSFDKKTNNIPHFLMDNEEFLPLVEIEKDDTELDVALDDLLKF